MTYEKYEKIKELEELKQKGAITEEEFQKEKDKILNEEPKVLTTETRQPLFGMAENSYLLLMHLSQFVSAIVVPLIMWLMGKDDNQRVDVHGKNIINFEITYAIWLLVGIITIPIIIGIVILSVIGIAMTVFIIVASVKAYNGEYWKYPFIIHFLK